MLNVSVDNWECRKGSDDPRLLGKTFWVCRAFANDYDMFAEWMDIHCPTAAWVYRYNSGNPAFSINISDEDEATIFKLTWISK